MIFLSVLAALILEHYQHGYRRDRLAAPFVSASDGLHHFFNSGLLHHGAIAWFLVITPLALFGYLVHALALLFGGTALSFVLNTLILSAAIDFKTISDRLRRLLDAFRANNKDLLLNELLAWEGQALPGEFDQAGLASRAIQLAILHAHARVLALIFWYVVTPGTSGLLVYLGASVLARRWPEPDSAFGDFAVSAFRVLDWVPARLTALSFAVVGNFEESLFCWRTQNKSEPKDSLRVVLSAGAGALGVHFESAPSLPWGVRNGDLGTGDFPSIEHLQTTESLLARTVVFAVTALLMATLGSVLGF